VEPELATKLVANSTQLAEHLQEIYLHASIEADNRILVCALITYAATLANKLELEGYDFLQLCDTAYQIMDPGPDAEAS